MAPTLESVAALPPGPELDALVIEHVMGWPVDDYGLTFGVTRYRRSEKWGDFAIPDPADPHWAWCPSRDWNAMGQAIAKYQEREYGSAMSLVPRGHDLARVEVVWLSGQPMPPDCFLSGAWLNVYGATLPHAVCRALLFVTLAVKG